MNFVGDFSEFLWEKSLSTSQKIAIRWKFSPDNPWKFSHVKWSRQRESKTNRTIFVCKFWQSPPCKFILENLPLEISLLMENTNMKKSIPRKSTPSPSTKNVSLYYPITSTICKQWSNFITCSPSPGNVGVHVVPIFIIIESFFYNEPDGYSKTCIWRFWGKRNWVGASCPPIFWSLKSVPELLIRPNEPSLDLLGPLVRHNNSWKKRIHLSSGKNLEIPHFSHGSLNHYSNVLYHAESDGVVFIKVPWHFGDISFLFRKSHKFSQARTF